MLQLPWPFLSRHATFAGRRIAWPDKHGRDCMRWKLPQREVCKLPTRPQDRGRVITPGLPPACHSNFSQAFSQTLQATKMFIDKLFKANNFSKSTFAIFKFTHPSPFCILSSFNGLSSYCCFTKFGGTSLFEFWKISSNRAQSDQNGPQHSRWNCWASCNLNNLTILTLKREQICQFYHLPKGRTIV